MSTHECPALGQSAHGVRFDWGPVGALAVADRVDVAVVVDVLSFTTTLSVAADLGTVVLPYPSTADDAAAYASQHRATLAVPRSQAGAGDLSVSPMSLRSAAPVARLVLPSPDGATIACSLDGVSTTVVGASLRNARAVADWIAREHDAETATVAIVAAGETWGNGSLRPAVEDLWGAGAVLAALEDHDWPGLSPEAAMAADVYRLVGGRELSHLRACASGVALIDAGHPDDVEVAAEVDSSPNVPLLSDRGFVPAP